MNIWVVVRSGRPLIFGGAATPLFVYTARRFRLKAFKASLSPTRPTRALSLCFGFWLDAGAATIPGPASLAFRGVWLRGWILLFEMVDFQPCGGGPRAARVV